MSRRRRRRAVVQTQHEDAALNRVQIRLVRLVCAQSCRQTVAFTIILTTVVVIHLCVPTTYVFVVNEHIETNRPNSLGQN